MLRESFAGIKRRLGIDVGIEVLGEDVDEIDEVAIRMAGVKSVRVTVKDS